MMVTTVMVVMILGWSGITLIIRGAQLPPLPTPRNLHFAPEALGFLQGTNLHLMFGLFGVMMAFGHSVLAMSGEETLAQVYREIAHPKLKNLKRTALIIAHLQLHVHRRGFAAGGNDRAGFGSRSGLRQII